MTAPSGRDLLLALGLIVLAWAALFALPPVYVVEGTIREVLNEHYPWQLGPRFDLGITNTAGKKLWFRGLRGDCPGPGRQFSECAKPEMPAGAPIRVVLYGFTDPNRCDPSVGSRRVDLSCLRNLDRIAAIEIDRLPVMTGWFSPASIFMLYGLIAAGIAILAFNRWHPSRISVRTATLYAFLICACVFLGHAYY